VDGSCIHLFDLHLVPSLHDANSRLELSLMQHRPDVLKKRAFLHNTGRCAVT
jgi:hypothetical protein